MLEHLSYSSISMYLSCPEAWRRKYIAEEPTFSSPALVFGSAMHGTIEAYITLPEEARSSEKLLELWSHHWTKQVTGEGSERGKPDNVVWGVETPEQHHNEGVRILSDAGVQYGIHAICSPGLQIERKVELRVPGVPVPIVGYIDVITLDGIPGDFKTSAKSWSNDRAAGELQPLFYLAALNQARVTVPAWKFRHYTIVKTKQPKFEVFEVEHSPRELFFLFDVIRRVWTGIEREVFPLNPTGWRCAPSYCDFWSNCRGKYV